MYVMTDAHGGDIFSIIKYLPIYVCKIFYKSYIFMAYPIKLLQTWPEFICWLWFWNIDKFLHTDMIQSPAISGELHIKIHYRCLSARL